MRSKLPSYFYLLLVSLIWGYAAIVIKQTLIGIAPLIFLTYRFAISGSFALFLLRKHQITTSLKNNFWEIFLYSFLSTTVSLTLLFLGLEKTSVLTLSLITVIYPLVLALLAMIFLKEKESKKQKLGTTIAFIGAFIAILAPLLGSMQNIGKFSGNLLIILSLTADLASVLFLKNLVRKGVSPLFLINISFVIGLITIIPVTLMFYSPDIVLRSIKSLSFNYHLGVFYMAIISGTVAYFLRAKAQKTLKVSEVGIFTYLQAIFSIIFAILILKEVLTSFFLIGGAIILAGIIIAEKKKI